METLPFFCALTFRGVVILLLGEPPATQYDFHFQVAGIPVRVHPFFWLAALILGSRGTSLEMVIWVVALFISILVHELGHSFMMLRFGISSHIVMYMMGGLAIPDSLGVGARSGNSRQGILISFAGPAAGFVLAALIAVAIVASGGSFGVHPEFFPFFWSFQLNEATASSVPLQRLIEAMLFINILWGMINLVPVYPLDGGQIARHIFTEVDPWQGIVKSLWLSVFSGGALVLFAVTHGSLFMAMLFGMLAFQSYTAIQSGGGGYGGGGFGGGFGRRGGPW